MPQSLLETYPGQKSPSSASPAFCWSNTLKKSVAAEDSAKDGEPSCTPSPAGSSLAPHPTGGRKTESHLW